MSDQTYIYALHDPRDWSIRYVGKANDPAKRFQSHIRPTQRLKRLRMFSMALQQLGLIPTMSILQICLRSEWQQWERFWIATVRASGADLLNVAPGGNQGPMLHALSDQTRAKMSAAKKGRVLSPEHCAKLSVAHKGKKRSPEVIAKSAATRTGMKRSLETRRKIGASRLGRKIGPLSPEHRAKLSLAFTGKKHSPERCRKNSESQKGWVCPPEVRAKISAALRGRKISPEWREKISAGLKGRNHADISRV